MLTFLLGLDPFIQGYCLVLVLLTLVLLLRAGIETRRVTRAAKVLSEFLATSPRPSEEERVQGRRLEVIEQLRSDAQKLPVIPSDWWTRLELSLAPYGSDPRSRGWFLTSSPSEVLDEDVVIHRHYDGSFFASVPGLLTSLGLLGTFVAILKGLSGLSLQGDIIKGVPNLVTSLSGKFTTSVLALGLSAIFAMIEALAFQSRMRAARERMIGVIRQLLPRLTSSHVLIDLHSESLKQSRSLANISADLVDKVAGLFADSFKSQVVPTLATGVSSGMALQLNENLVPVLERVNESMTQVGAAIQRLESTKQESVVGEIRGLTASLQQSLTASLADVSERFSEALRGSTRDEFGGLAKIIQDSGAVLGQMNATFSTMQSALQSLIEESRTTTSDQMAKSVERSEQLNRLVEGLLIRLNESASQNASHVSTVLTQVVSDLSDKVTSLSNDLTAQVKAAASQTQEAAAKSLQVAGEWSARSDERLTAVLGALETKVADFDKASAALLGAQKVVEVTLSQSADGIRAMKEAANEVRTYSGSLGGLQTRLAEAQAAQTQVALSAQRALASLEEMSNRHETILAHYDGTLSKADQIFAGLDERLRRSLEVILQKVLDYNTAVEKNFQEVVKHLNVTMPQMGEVLAGAALELREQVDELTEVLANRNGRQSA